MKVSVEISMYPLTPHYGTPILQFIEKLKSYPAIRVKSNDMSTQLFGDYDEVMAILTKEVKSAFQTDATVSMVVKMVNMDLQG
ncbi:MAG TPA: YkoF family thiamine/hydroxymethylpyrimidine-binding protein [Saprospiraceae bacterium]|nr:YkoF family thiamine/hydroxymethylpyrimidine-binding protein [Saprospiraceae bacterium]